MASSEEELRRVFCDAEQGHVFRFWDELSAEEHKSLLGQLAAVDLEQIRRLVETHLADRTPEAPADVQPAPVLPIPGTPEELREAAESRRVGEEALAAGRVALVMLAGGQASRMGSDLLKGSLPVTPVTRKSLFALQCEKTLALQRRYGYRIPLMVLVSPENEKVTRTYFEERKYFGLLPEDVWFFEQGMLPAVDRNGRLILATRGSIFLSPDGHGGAFRALARSGLIEKLEQRDIDTVFFFQVDNPLVKVADPTFLGHHLRADANASLKVVRRRDEQEKVGTYCLIDGHPGVIEYSDLDKEIRGARDAAGELLFWAGSIAIHAFQVEFVKRCSSGEVQLPYHMARKKVPYVDDSGELQQPAELNGIKFEAFVFDALGFADRVAAMEVERAEEFAPVKQQSGEDSQAAAVEAQSWLFRSWLRDAGIPVEDEKALVEIGPLFAADREELVRKIREDGLRGARKVLLD